MSAPSFVFLVSFPSGQILLEQATSVRFTTHDGSRGILPRHERATAFVSEGMLLVKTSSVEQDRFVATEGGMAVIGPQRVVILTDWAAVAVDIPSLVAQVRTRARARERSEAEARALSERHETALRRALLGLRREVAW